MPIVSAVVIVCLLAIGGVVLFYNHLVRLRAMVAEAWSGIEVQLKRRANLIPNLVTVVKGYMGHERAVLEEITELRSKSLAAQGVAASGDAETALAFGLRNLFAVVENYPDLKADSSFLDLHRELSDTEDKIEMARRYYNGTVRNLNIGVQSFPANLIAGKFGFHEAEFFQIDDPGDRAVPRVQLPEDGI